jgi:putative transposase
MARPAPVVDLSARQRAILGRISAARRLPQRLVERAPMFVAADEGMSGTAIAERMNVDPQRPRRWRRRWAEVAPAINDAEAAAASDRDLRMRISEALADAPRPGTPVKFSAEIVALLVSLACEPPEDSGVPVTHWTPDLLAKEAITRGIVEEISPRHLDRLLKRC